MTRAWDGSIWRKSFARGIASDFRDGAGQLHAGRSAPDNHESHCRLAARFVTDLFRVLKSQQQAPAHFNGVFETLQPGRQYFPFVMAEIGMPGSGRENEKIVIDLDIGCFNFPGIDIDRLHFGQDHFHIFTFAQDAPDGRRDVGRRKRGRRDLVEEGLKKMIIRPVDDRDTNIFAGQSLGCLKSPETAADDYEMRLVVLRLHAQQRPTPPRLRKASARRTFNSEKLS